MILNALTVDLEDWYQAPISISRQIDNWPGFEKRIVSNTRKLLRLLSQAQVRATFFVLGYIAEQHPDLVLEVSNAGHEIALHSYLHRRVYQMTPEEFRADVQKGMNAVQAASGQKVCGYRAPMFSVNASSLWALEVLADLGFRYDSSIFPIHNMLYGIPGASRFPYRPFEGEQFIEFPLATIRSCGVNFPAGGGLYSRILPYSWIKASIQSLNHQGQPAVIYIHPWELDTEQHFHRLTLRERITHYVGRSGLETKFKRMLRDFKFGCLEHISAKMNHGV